MATTKPRITVSLSQRQYDVLRIISECGGKPMSAFITEILEESLPVLERMAEYFRKIKVAQDEQKKRIAAELEQAQSAVEPVLDQVMGQFDLFMTRLEQASVPGVGDARERAPAPGSEALLTPVTNRGVTPSPLKARKPSQHKALQPPKAQKVSRKSPKPEGA